MLLSVSHSLVRTHTRTHLKVSVGIGLFLTSYTRHMWATSVYCIIVSPSSPIACLSPCTPLIRTVLQTFLHLTRHSAISSFSLIFNLGLLSHLLFLFLSSSAKNRKAKRCCCITTRTAAVTQYPSLIFSFPRTNVSKIKYIVVSFQYSSHGLS